jgi:hypothetical protein
MHVPFAGILTIVLAPVVRSMMTIDLLVVPFGHTFKIGSVIDSNKRFAI